MKDYLVLIRGGDERMEALTEEERSAHMANWGTYMKGLAASGNLAGGFPLMDDGRVVTGESAKEEVVTSDKGEAIGGYLLFKANDYNHAVALSKGCPIFEHGGNLEIREAMEMRM